MLAAMRSLFTRIWATSAGIDPYATAVSDVYQDLFGAGTYTGKGIYDIDAFQAALGNTFPTNSILSHDLIEGTYARCGLVSDIQVFDDFPARYHSFSRREHRWVRGDWQLLPWLGRQVPTVPVSHEAQPQAGQQNKVVYIPNPLPLLEHGRSSITCAVAWYRQPCWCCSYSAGSSSQARHGFGPGWQQRCSGCRWSSRPLAP